MLNWSQCRQNSASGRYSNSGDMHTLWIFVVVVLVFPEGFPMQLDDVKLGQLNWYITGKISDIIREELKDLSQNVTADKLDCENQIKTVSDTCFECNRLIGEQQKAAGPVLEKTTTTNKTKISIKPTIDWKRIRDKIEKKSGKVIRKLSDFFEELSKIRFPKINFPEVKLPDIQIPKIDLPKISLPKFDFSKIQIPKITIPSVDLSKFRIPSITIPQIDLGGIQIPKFTIPSIKLPKEFPSIDLGSIFRGRRSITDCNDCEQFRTANEEYIIMKVCGSQYVKESNFRKMYFDKLESLNSALESNFVYNVTFDETSMDYLRMTVNLISIDYRLSNSTAVHTYHATGEQLHLLDMIRSAEILAPKLFQDFLN